MNGPLRHPVLQWLVYGHLWLALAVAAQIQWTGIFLHDAPDLWRYTIAAALGSFAGYASMRLARVRGPEVERFPNLSWYRSQRVLITVLVVASIVAAFILIWPLWTVVWPWLLPVIVIAFFYMTPFTASSGRGIGIRSIPFLKALLIAVLWVIVVVAVPVRLDLEEHAPFNIIAAACMRVPLILALAITFDIRDSATDDPALRTVPLVFGVRGAKLIALCLLLFSALFEVVFLRSLDYIAATWTILIGYALAVFLVIRAKPVRDPIYYALYVDGVMIVIPLCVWIGSKW